MKGLRRSFQFVPSNNPGMVQSADILGADSIIFDLEDAVAISEKDAARDLLAEALKSLDYSAIEVLVRVNPIDTPFFTEDIQILKELPVDGYLIPKATLESMKETIKEIEKAGINASILPLIETAMGLEEVFEITGLSDKIDGVLLGGEDLSLDLGVTRTKEGNEIRYARARVVSACKAKKITCIDTPFTDSDDMEGLIKDTEYAKSIGFTAKASINPRHLDAIHDVFSPSEKEVRYALRVMEAVKIAEKENKGVFSLDGKMIDAPVISRATDMIEKARILGLIREDGND